MLRVSRRLLSRKAGPVFPSSSNSGLPPNVITYASDTMDGKTQAETEAFRRKAYTEYAEKTSKARTGIHPILGEPEHTGSLLDKHIRQLIWFRGPIPIRDFMKIALTHPQHGYYTTKKEVIGEKGDFVTSPEICQVFGELIGVWIVLMWQAQGSPSTLRLVELGPGKGTLMADALRSAIKVCPEIKSALKLELVEVSEGLMSTQKTALKDSGVPMEWKRSFGEVSKEDKVLVIAHEFFDAAPVYQIEFSEEKKEWMEILVDIDMDKTEGFKLVKGQSQALAMIIKNQAESDLHQEIVKLPAFPKPGDRMEFSLDGLSIAQEIGDRIGKTGGGALVIDYGKEGGIFNSVRGIRDHKFINFLEDVGNVDLSVDVDFAALKRAFTASNSNVVTSQVIVQSEFLKSLGIDVRMQKMIEQLDNQEQIDLLRSAYERLVGDMGGTFKVLGVSDSSVTFPPNFVIPVKAQ